MPGQGRALHELHRCCLWFSNFNTETVSSKTHIENCNSILQNVTESVFERWPNRDKGDRQTNTERERERRLFHRLNGVQYVAGGGRGEGGAAIC